MLSRGSDSTRNLITTPHNSVTTIFSNNEPWMESALCSTLDPYAVDEIFFPEKGYTSDKAKVFCMACPVRRECSQYAIQAPDLLYGFWGGTTMRDRRKLRRIFGIEAV